MWFFETFYDCVCIDIEEVGIMAIVGSFRLGKLLKYQDSNSLFGLTNLAIS